MLDTSCAALPGTAVALLQLEHEDVIGGEWMDLIGHDDCSFRLSHDIRPENARSGEARRAFSSGSQTFNFVYGRFDSVGAR